MTFHDLCPGISFRLHSDIANVFGACRDAFYAGQARDSDIQLDTLFFRLKCMFLGIVDPSLTFSLMLSGSEGYWPSSSLSAGTGHLVFGVMENNQTLPTGIQFHSTTPTRRGEISANKLGTSGKCAHMYVCSSA